MSPSPGLGVASPGGEAVVLLGELAGKVPPAAVAIGGPLHLLARGGSLPRAGRFLLRPVDGSGGGGGDPPPPAGRRPGWLELVDPPGRGSKVAALRKAPHGAVTC